MSAAWLTWSPEGLGWQCFRHYQAPLAFSVPLINEPTIARYRPLIDGVHAFYYQPDDPDSLGRVIRAALADQAQLRTIASAARAHVLANHIQPRPLADALVRMGLGLEEAPGGVDLEIGAHIGAIIDGVAEQRRKFSV
jgi:glycosyltransferase involved in cell wall biosynthesis